MSLEVFSTIPITEEQDVIIIITGHNLKENGEPDISFRLDTDEEAMRFVQYVRDNIIELYYKYTIGHVTEEEWDEMGRRGEELWFPLSHI